jgi:hypothetical protein
MKLMRPGGVPAMRRSTVTTDSRGIAKLVTAAQRQGNPGIAKQQITELEIYDYLPLTSSAGFQTLRFFENVRTRQFPFTNLSENKLQPGEMMILKRIWFTIMTTAAADPDEQVLNVETFASFGLPGLSASQMNWYNDNTRVVKNKSLVSFRPEFNKGAFNQNMNVLELNSEITIPTQVAFMAELLIPAITFVSEDSVFIGMHCEGIGTILNPKNPY